MPGAAGQTQLHALPSDLLFISSLKTRSHSPHQPHSADMKIASGLLADKPESVLH